MSSSQTYETCFIQAPLVGRGIIRLVNLRPEWKGGLWICDECGDRIYAMGKIETAGQRHMKTQHGWKS